MRVEIADRSRECLFQDGGEGLAQARVVAVARHVDEAGDEPFEGVTAHEQRDPLALLQVQDARRGLEQLVGCDLEQFVPRKGLEDVQEGLAVVALGAEPGALHRPPNLLPQ